MQGTSHPFLIIFPPEALSTRGWESGISGAHICTPRATSFPHLRSRGTKPALPPGPWRPGLARAARPPSTPSGCACHGSWCHLPDKQQEERHLPRLRGHLEGVTEGSGDKPRRPRGPRHQPHLHARPTKLKTHAARMQMPFEIRNHFKTPGVSVLHLAIISLFQLAFLSTELETHFHRLFSLPASGPKHRRPYLTRCDIPVAWEPGRRAAHGSLALPAFSPPHFLPGGCSRALSQEMLSASCTCNTR